MNPELYLCVRRKEGRIYTDDMVARLPEVPPGHPLRAEWQMRAASARRLITYLSGFQKTMTILELGCGNGWLASRMAQVSNTRVVGLERNTLELTQAARVFNGNGCVSWLEADIFRAPFLDRRFNAIVIASAIQYFPDVTGLIRALVRLLAPEGEIHIIDSPLYSAETRNKARERTRTYYENLGFPQMADHYHHHLLSSLDPYHPVTRYVPVAGSGDSPFPWICLSQGR